MTPEEIQALGTQGIPIVGRAYTNKNGECRQVLGVGYSYVGWVPARKIEGNGITFTTGDGCSHQTDPVHFWAWMRGEE